MGTSHTCLSHRAVSIPVRAPPRYTSITTTSGRLLIANALASFSFDAHCTRRNPTHASKLPDRMQSETHHRRLVPDARPDLVPLVTCVFGVLTSQRAQARLVPAAARFSQTRTRDVVVSGTWRAIGWTAPSLGHQSAPKKLSRSVIEA